MALIRLSVIKDTLYAPGAKGNLVVEDYNRRRRMGKMRPLPQGDFLKQGSQLHDYLIASIGTQAAALPVDQPIVIMVHGFLFDPAKVATPDPKETDNPHGRLYHFQLGNEDEEIRHHTSSWPLGLGFAEDDDGASGLAIAFGWNSQPGFASSIISHFQNFYARAYETAGSSAWVLLNLILTLREILPGRRIDLFCHSLGSRVVIRALAQLFIERPASSDCLRNILILGGAEYVVEASLMMNRLATAGASHLSFYNIVSRENDVLDTLAENFGPRTFGNSQVIGHNGLDVESPGPNWLDLQIDKASLQDWLAKQRGLSISGDQPGNVWDHWYYYTHRGNMGLYKNILRQPDNWQIAALRAAGIPDRVSKRWSLFGD
ncbi:MAG: alpha/beta hydrolase [Rhodocyclaceae bacterium]